MREIPKEPPHIIHADPDFSYPPHTHGLSSVGLPEMFINARAFTIPDAVSIINDIVIFLYSYNEHWDKCINGEDMEITLIPDEPDFIVCLRKVEKTFAGVTTAYNDEQSSTGFRQIYVKGDNHVLTDEYFIQQDKKSSEAKCTGHPDCIGCQAEKNKIIN